MRRELVSIALGLGLAAGSVGPIYAQAGEPGTPTRPAGEGSDQPRPQSSPGTTQNPSSPAASSGTVMDMGIAMGDNMTTRPMTRADMVATARDFYADTQQNWSPLGFSSAAQARAVLGGEWWDTAAKTLGIQMSQSGQVMRDPCRVTSSSGSNSERSSEVLPAGQCN